MNRTTAAISEQSRCQACDQVVVPGVACGGPFARCPVYGGSALATRKRGFLMDAAAMAMPDEFDAVRGED